jgi:hypothetical protein
VIFSLPFGVPWPVLARLPVTDPHSFQAAIELLAESFVVYGFFVGGIVP